MVKTIGFLADTAEYLEHLKQLQLGANIAPLFGHSALRSCDGIGT